MATLKEHEIDDTTLDLMGEYLGGPGSNLERVQDFVSAALKQLARDAKQASVLATNEVEIEGVKDDIVLKLIK